MTKPKEGLSPKLMLLTHKVGDSVSWIIDLLRNVLTDAFPAEPAYLSFLGLNLTILPIPCSVLVKQHGLDSRLCIVLLFLCEAWTRGQEQ